MKRTFQGFYIAVLAVVPLVVAGCAEKTDRRPWRVLRHLALDEQLVLETVTTERALALGLAPDDATDDERRGAWRRCVHRSEYLVILSKHVDAACDVLSDVAIPTRARCPIGQRSPIEAPPCAGDRDAALSNNGATPDAGCAQQALWQARIDFLGRIQGVESPEVAAP